MANSTTATGDKSGLHPAVQERQPFWLKRTGVTSGGFRTRATAVQRCQSCAPKSFQGTCWTQVLTSAGAAQLAPPLACAVLLSNVELLMSKAGSHLPCLSLTAPRYSAPLWRYALLPFITLLVMFICASAEPSCISTAPSKQQSR